MSGIGRSEVDAREFPGDVGKSNMIVQCLVLLALPWLLLLLNSQWIYTPSGYLDPWTNHGYFLNFSQHLEVFKNDYSASRLPFLLTRPF